MPERLITAQSSIAGCLFQSAVYGACMSIFGMPVDALLLGAIAAGMAAANQHIAVLQDAVDLEMATAEEEAALKTWKKYRVLLSRAQSDAKYPNVTLPQRPDGGIA